ncbi:hypothetical protein GU243_09235 [Pseudarthrobacter psychrotolerans]|uniref:Lipase (Class 3) n=1 Tax=Pseudarthrobacter psychrotolerans TaxID=2697569 RepID=A0A6P1NGY1_9MICC|nr:hypothetical protein [Pseudarthrobacter psychrotolerans]QHK19885.1 hypothetical protein GU243_09235 [Pseudarthrobacter psychrotolerans]
MGDPANSAPKVPATLELRIHGIRNTPPHELLQCDVADVSRVQGDELGGFFTTKALSSGPTYVEAYSWGKLARTSPVASIFGKVGAVASNLAWFLLLPFGLANAAYWARRLQKDGPKGGSQLAAGNGAGTVRLFALLLSVFYTTALCTVAFDLLAVQCFRHLEGVSGVSVCSQLSGAADMLRDLTRGQRLTILASMPLLGMGLLFAISLLSNAKYRRRTLRLEARSLEGTEAGAVKPPILAASGFWDRRFVSSSTGVLHIAACFSFVALLINVDSVAALQSAGCSESGQRFDLGCLTEPLRRASERTVEMALLVSGGLLLLMVAFLVVAWSAEVRAPVSTALRRKRAAGLVMVAVVLHLAGTLSVAYFATPDDSVSRGFSGTRVAPLVLLALLTILSLSAAVTRSGVPAIRAFVLISISTASLLVWSVMPASDLILLVPLVAGLVLAIDILRVRRRRHAVFEHEGWFGFGPGVFMFLAVMFASFLSGSLVVGVAEFLRSPRIISHVLEQNPVWRSVTESAALGVINVPPSYRVFAGVLLAAIVVASAAVLTLAGVNLVRRRIIAYPPAYDSGVGMPAGIPGEFRARRLPADLGPHLQRVADQQRWSSLAQRGEPATWIVVLLVWLAVTVSLAATAARNSSLGDSTMHGWLHDLAEFVDLNLAGWGVVAGAVLVLGLAIGNAASSKDRPLSLIWDIICFLPRAAHPFAPPCYGERVVPELSDRMAEWLRPAEPTGARIVLSAHSLGAVLAIAALFHLKATSPETDFTRIRLLTYGVQLRSYFGRFFPELLGPAALSTAPSVGPALRPADPWSKQVARDFALANDEQSTVHEKYSLASLLNGDWGNEQPSLPRNHWINIWRRTDYLGFPIDSFCTGPGQRDRIAEEIEPSGYMEEVATHSNYPSTAAYTTARNALIST